jgi:uncharacterized protein DUF4129
VLRSSSRPLGLLIVARVLTESIAFGCLLAMAHGFSGGTAPVSLVAITAAVSGVALILVAALRDASSERRGGAILVGTLLASLAVAYTLPTRQLDAVGWLGRFVLFAIVGEAFLWRIVTLARGAIRWSDARNAAPFAVIVVVVAAIAPLPIDRTPLAAFALLLVAAAAISLALARALEELSLAPRARATGLSSLTSILFGLGVLAIGFAVIAPYVEQLLRDGAVTIATAFDTLLFFALLPFGLLAAGVLYLLEPLFHNIDFSFLRRTIQPMTPEEEEARLRELERNRPLVVGGVEIAIVLAVIFVGLILLERVMRERRLVLPEAAELEREAAGGMSLGDTLRGLFPNRSARRRPPHDDGSPGARLRIAYWRLLALAERAGHGWRASGETPEEHHRRVAAADQRFGEALPLVSAFEDLRYGEREPDRATAERASAIVVALETALRS